MRLYNATDTIALPITIQAQRSQFPPPKTTSIQANAIILGMEA